MTKLHADVKQGQEGKSYFCSSFSRLAVNISADAFFSPLLLHFIGFYCSELLTHTNESTARDLGAPFTLQKVACFFRSVIANHNRSAGFYGAEAVKMSSEQQC